MLWLVALRNATLVGSIVSMATEPTGEKINQVKLSIFPDHITNYVEFKREMVRLDYTAEQLRTAIKEVEDKMAKLQNNLTEMTEKKIDLEFISNLARL